MPHLVETFAEWEANQGERIFASYNGEAYLAIATDYQPDHLAATWRHCLIREVHAAVKMVAVF